jgi:sugar O-acyltransferase (sialic acid O-acetyltransferase NeuD family)
MGKFDHIVVIGAGGHAKVVVSTLLTAGLNVNSLYDDDPEKWGKEILGIRVTDALSELDGVVGRQAIFGIGDNFTRKQLANRFRKLDWVSVIHPGAYVHPSVSLGKGTVVFAGAIIQPDAVIGEHCIINSGATVDHDCILGDYVHIAPGVNLAGNVKIEEGVFFGIGGAAIIGINIGEWSVIGAGAVVVKNIPENVTAAGIPARIIKKGKVK